MTAPIQSHEFVSPAERDPFGMRIADLLVQHRLPTVKEQFAMERTVYQWSDTEASCYGAK